MRIALNEITLTRIRDAVMRRLKNIPDTFAWSYSQYAKQNTSNIRRYKNIHNGKRCFIIANGPSLKNMDLSLLRNEFTFSMNRAYLMYEAWGFKPSYFVCINELVLEQFAEDISQLQMPKFINFNRRHEFDTYDKNDSILSLRLGYQLSDTFSTDVTRVISSGGTVTFACLQLAYYMGFSEVIIIGLDHSFSEKGTPNKTEVRKSHVDQSHCHPDYFPKGIKWQLPDLLRSEIAYSLSRKAFENSNRKIYDATFGGKCNVFEKKDFTSFLNHKGVL